LRAETPKERRASNLWNGSHPYMDKKRKRSHHMKLLTALLLITSTALLAADENKATPADRMNREVRHELTMLPYYGVFDNLAYRVDGSKVTLFGQVTRPVLKTNAEKAVKGIEGVQSVDNNIEVLPLSPNDDRIRLDVYRAIYSKAPLQRYQLNVVPPIHIMVKNGNVTLEGYAANSGDKNIAEVAAKGVSGVFGVTNNLQVQPNRLDPPKETSKR
jgi:hyperosmotically inducible protein